MRQQRALHAGMEPHGAPGAVQDVRGVLRGRRAAAPGGDDGRLRPLPCPGHKRGAARHMGQEGVQPDPQRDHRAAAVRRRALVRGHRRHLGHPAPPDRSRDAFLRQRHALLDRGHRGLLRQGGEALVLEGGLSPGRRGPGVQGALRQMVPVGGFPAGVPGTWDGLPEGTVALRQRGGALLRRAAAGQPAALPADALYLLPCGSELAGGPLHHPAPGVRLPRGQAGMGHKGSVPLRGGADGVPGDGAAVLWEGFGQD